MKDAKRFAGVIALALIAACALGFVLSAWLRSRFLADFWPLDASRVGPNLVASVVQALIVLAVVACVYPPLRKWMEREFDHVHAKMDHIIRHHPDIPDFPSEPPQQPQ